MDFVTGTNAISKDGAPEAFGFNCTITVRRGLTR